jgi:hypothetical protein
MTLTQLLAAQLGIEPTTMRGGYKPIFITVVANSTLRVTDHL